MKIESKKFTTFLGPSGCGKTTILLMIAGLETPGGGEIWFDDTCVFSEKKHVNLPPEKRNLGFVFQDFALWPHMTVFENVAFPLRARKRNDNIEETVMNALKTVKLENLSERYPSQMSGGQQQRVAFARAIAGNVDCILFDEPLSALDAILREEFAKAGLEGQVWQYFTAIPDFKSVGVRDNARTFEWPVILRAVNTVDAMTASVADLPFSLLQKITARITAEVKGVNRVLYDITPKPSGTIEFE